MRTPLAAGNDGRRARYLPGNDTARSPAMLITFDTESSRKKTDSGETHTLRMWTARIVTRRPQKTKTPDNETASGYTGYQLAEAINGWIRSAPSCWLYSHNLGYDLPVSGLIDNLCALGWSVSECSSDPAYCWLTLKKGKQSITVSDLYHLLSMRLAAIGDLIGAYKLPMPAADAPDSEWFTYCQNDTDIAMLALIKLMRHWDDYSLGIWRMTGAACGFTAMRHAHDGGRMVLFDDSESAEWDRRAIYGGRRHVWRHGSLPPGRYINFDIEAAYATAAANWNLPHKRGDWFNSMKISDSRIWRPEICVIAECEIEADRPVFPVRAAGGIAWPVGRFRTVLAGPEIAYARQLGMLHSIGRGQFHLLGAGMRPFFQRVVDWGRPGKSAIDPVAAAMWKQFGRGVVGKFCQRGYRTEVTNMLTDQHWFYEQGWDEAAGRAVWLVHKDGRIEKRWQEGDARNAYPAVTAVVESIVRVTLDKALCAAGEHAPVLCDTDGFWADMTAMPDLAAINKASDPFIVREKDSTARLIISGPQSYDWDRGSRHAGRPSGMQATGAGSWAGDVFPGLAWQMTHGKAGEYQLLSQEWRTEACTVRAWVLDNGTVRPLEAFIDAAGNTAVQPWPQTSWAAMGETLGTAQHVDLAQYTGR